MEGNHCKGTMHTGTTDPALHPDKRSRWKPRCLAVEVQKETALSVVNCIKCFSTKAIPKVLQTSKEIRSCPVLGNLLTITLANSAAFGRACQHQKKTHVKRVLKNTWGAIRTAIGNSSLGENLAPDAELKACWRSIDEIFGIVKRGRNSSWKMSLAALPCAGDICILDQWDH